MTMKVVVVIFMGQRMYGVIRGHTTGHGQGPGYCKHDKMYCWMLDRQNVLPNVRPSNVLAIVRVSKILANVRVSHKLARERMSNITADVRMCKRKYAHVRIFWLMWAHSKALSNMNNGMSTIRSRNGAWVVILGTWGLGTTQCVVGSTHWVRSAVLHRNCIKEWLLFFNSIKCENEAAKIGKQICMKVQIWIVKMKSRLGRRKVFGQREVPGVVVPRQHSHRPGASPAGLPCPNFRGQKVHGRCPVRWW